MKTYRHYKGNLYKVIAEAKHSETMEDLIVYQDVKDETKVWVRPKEMFFEEIEVDGKMQSRFKQID